MQSLAIGIHFLFIVVGVANAQVIQNGLNADWRFAQCKGGCRGEKLSYLNAVVPGSVYADVLRNHLTSNAFNPDGEAHFRNLEQSNWMYETQPFDAPEDIFNSQHVYLRFNGLDTYAVIELNGTEILKVNNAHRRWIADVRKILKRKGNVLKIKFASTAAESLRYLNALDYPLPGDSLRAASRTPQFHFGWDWAPRILSCGITHSIEWIAYNGAVVRDCYMEQLHVSESSAELNCIITGFAHVAGNVRLEMECLNNGQRWSGSQQVSDSSWVLKLPAVILSPSLWWSNGLGNPNITEFRCKVFFNDELIEDKVCKTGLRRLELKTEVAGKKLFHFELNGAPVFAKGANYIPLHYFPSDSHHKDYQEFLLRCRDANINMIRVWGGGYYEADEFYDLCDEYGIMIWHDFMFACTMYPGENSFVANIRAEAEEQVIRLRNHPCMALWCGNNEVSEGWQRWGWKDGLTKAQVDSLDDAYSRIFLNVLPELVSKHSNISYHPSSPLFGRGDSLSQSVGDMHDWAIWHDELPMEELSKRIPRFMSEFGVQSFPSSEVMLMMSKDPFHESDSAFINHQRHPRGFRLMRDYANRWYPDVASLDYRKYGYITQAVQAEGIVNAINWHRIRQPYCMGTLFWQLNDVWPAFSWSALDYAQNEKILFKMLQEAYAPQTVVALLHQDSLRVYWVSDRPCDRDSALLYLRWNKPTEALDDIPDGPGDFDRPGLKCQLQSGVKLLYQASIVDIFGASNTEVLSDWTLDCALQVQGQDDLLLARKFRLVPGSKRFIVPDILEEATGGKRPENVIRRQVFRKL